MSDNTPVIHAPSKMTATTREKNHDPDQEKKKSTHQEPPSSAPDLMTDIDVIEFAISKANTKLEPYGISVSLEQSLQPNHLFLKIMDSRQDRPGQIVRTRILSDENWQGVLVALMEEAGICVDRIA